MYSKKEIIKISKNQGKFGDIVIDFAQSKKLIK